MVVLPLIHAALSLPRRMRHAWQQHRAVLRARRELRGMSDRELRDVGIGRCQVEACLAADTAERDRCRNGAPDGLRCEQGKSPVSVSPQIRRAGGQGCLGHGG